MQRSQKMQRVGPVELFAMAEGMSRAAIERDRVSNPDDYVLDGLLHCAICNEPKEMRLPVPEEIFGRKETVIDKRCLCEQARLEKQLEEERRAEHARQVERRRRDSLMDKRLYGATFDAFEGTPENKKALAVCKRYVEVFETIGKKTNQGLLFYGAPGTGKTFAAACIANALIEQGKSVMVTSVAKLMRYAYNGGDEWQGMVQKICRAQLFVLDDLGADSETDTAVAHVYGIIDDRYASDMPVIYTTNLTMTEMKNPGDIRKARIYDRVLQNCYPVQFAGASRRMKDAAQRYAFMQALEAEEGDER